MKRLTEGKTKSSRKELKPSKAPIKPPDEAKKFKRLSAFSED